MQAGMIILWSGAIVDIPDGFALCDGSNGTPDLRNRFIVGAGDLHAVGATGGTTSHEHGFYDNGHIHTIGAGIGLNGGNTYKDQTNIGHAEGTTEIVNNLPPYYALAYIMKT